MSIPLGVKSRRDFIGLRDVPSASAAVTAHALEVVQRRRDQGLPCCGDDVADVRKLSALVEEVGEVARCIQDGEPLGRLATELRDVATAATLWAWAVEQEAAS